MKCALALTSPVVILTLFNAAEFAKWANNFSNWASEQGFIGVGIFVIVYALITSACLPASPLTIAAGAFFGPVIGSLASIAGLTISAGLGFVIARYVARGPFERRLKKSPRFHMIDRAIGQEGWKIVGLLRLCPLPFGITNYAYGLTAIDFLHYLAATVVGVLPSTGIFVYMGAAGMKSLQAIAEGREAHRTAAEWILIGLMLLAAVAALGIIGRIVKKAIEVKIDETELA
jgi:uncharacterized membrane protein YdjX (TVP38/TMEM64 family)